MKKINILPTNIADIYAIRALFNGTAEAEQQKRAVKCVVEEICQTYAMTFDPESDRQTAFNEGKRHVGRILVGIANANMAAINAADEKLEKLAKPVTRKGRPNG